MCRSFFKHFLTPFNSGSGLPPGEAETMGPALQVAGRPTLLSRHGTKDQGGTGCKIFLSCIFNKLCNCNSLKGVGRSNFVPPLCQGCFGLRRCRPWLTRPHAGLRRAGAGQFRGKSGLSGETWHRRAAIALKKRVKHRKTGITRTGRAIGKEHKRGILCKSSEGTALKYR